MKVMALSIFRMIHEVVTNPIGPPAVRQNVQADFQECPSGHFSYPKYHPTNKHSGERSLPPSLFAVLHFDQKPSSFFILFFERVKENILRLDFIKIQSIAELN
jgi:hypothetical protein